MTSEDFTRIFYSNFTPNINWDDIDEISWMYQEGLFSIHQRVIASIEEFNKKIDLVLDPKKGYIKSGEGDSHLALKSFAKDYLVQFCGVPEEDIQFECPLVGFEVDVIDKGLQFPTECGDANALKLEKYLSLSTTKKMLILPYPHFAEVKVFEFVANPKFHEYIKHKQSFLNRKNAKFR